MIINAEIINQPYAGQYKERIYDISSSWNTQDWTWVKFINEDFTEWCGEFRGLAKGIAISNKYNVVLILTSDYLYQLDCNDSEIIEYEDKPQYQQITVMPSGDFLLADDYNINVIKTSLKNKIPVKSPISMDNIKFEYWSENGLIITCEEFLNWDNHVKLELNNETLKLTIVNTHNHSGMLPKEECEALMNELMPIGIKFLKKNGEFYPYCAVMNVDDTINLVGYYDRDEFPNSKEVMEYFKETCRQFAIDKKIKASGIAWNTSVTSEDGSEIDAILISLEHRDGYSVKVGLHYKKRIFRGVKVGSIFALDGDNEIF